MINKVTLIGNVGQDIELRSMQNGNKVVNISPYTTTLCHSTASFFSPFLSFQLSLVARDKLPEMLAKYAKKGSKLFVEGSIKSRKYNDSTGTERRSFEIVVQGYGSTVKILDSRDSIGAEQDSCESYTVMGDEIPF